MMGSCVVCDGAIRLSEGTVPGELIPCPDCGTELEVLSLDPVVFGEAPVVQEDWGE